MRQRPPSPPAGRRPAAVAAALVAAALAAGVVPALAPSAARAVSPPDTVAGAAARAALAVHGRVKRVESRWNRGQTAIYTDVTLEVLRRLGGADKGLGGGSGGVGEVTLRIPGGVVGKTGMRVSHVIAPPQPGQEVVALLAAAAAQAGKAAGAADPEEGAALDADARTLTLVSGEQGWLPVRAGAVELDGGRRAPVAELLATLAASLRN